MVRWLFLALLLVAAPASAFQTHDFNWEDEKRARLLGLTWRFAFSLSATAAGELSNYRLRVTPAKVILEVPKKREAIASEPVQKRLGVLADAMDRRGEILIG